MTDTVKLKKDQILFLAEEKENDIYIIESGKVMVFVQKGSQIIPIAYLEKGEYIGELTFFDEGKRSASIICLEDSEFTRIPSDELNENCPMWVKVIGQQLTRKIREGDELIRSKGIRKKNVEGIKPLSIEEQSRYFKIVDQKKQSKSS
ncbi:MAG: cyclic nucleotide-binding domain-containing protein [Bdellovibrionales bacterium]|nr:cyclic nucleotide-binding domain-containing protein [Bdellovibrionales bacterium]